MLTSPVCCRLAFAQPTTGAAVPGLDGVRLRQGHALLPLRPRTVRCGGAGVGFFLACLPACACISRPFLSPHASSDCLSAIDMHCRVATECALCYPGARGVLAVWWVPRASVSVSRLRDGFLRAFERVRSAPSAAGALGGARGERRAAEWALVTSARGSEITMCALSEKS